MGFLIMSDRVMTEIKCSDCGKTATVPFKPTAGKPVYCKECLTKHRSRSTRTGKTESESSSKQAWSRRRENWKDRTEKPVPA
jgi:CxxC-x17-CxxC domain-containing protein